MTVTYTDIIEAREKALERGLEVTEVRLTPKTIEEMQENMVSAEDVSGAVGTIEGPDVVEADDTEELVAVGEGGREVTFDL